MKRSILPRFKLRLNSNFFKNSTLKISIREWNKTHLGDWCVVGFSHHGGYLHCDSECDLVAFKLKWSDDSAVAALD